MKQPFSSVGTVHGASSSWPQTWKTSDGSPVILQVCISIWWSISWNSSWHCLPWSVSRHHSCTVGISDFKIILGSSGLVEFQLTSSCKPVILSLTIDRYIATDKGLVQNPRTHHWGALKDSCHLPQSKVYELSPFACERATWWSEENLLVIRWQCLTLSLLKVIISLFRRYCSLFQINGIWWCIRD